MAGQATPNPLVNRTRNGMPRLGPISFWPKRVLPLRAGYRERYASNQEPEPFFSCVAGT